MMRKPTKSHLICHVLAEGGPQGRVEVLEKVNALEGFRTRFKPASNHCYFTEFGGGNGGYISLVHRGLVRIVSRRPHKYELTNAGMRLAREYQEWVNR